MRRKIIQIANSTQLVSLPRKWALEMGLVKGAELEVEVDGNRLIISQEGGNKRLIRAVTIDVREKGAKVKKLIGALYRAGYDQITINKFDYNTLQHVQAVLREGCIGFEIVEQSPNKVIIKNVTVAADDSFDRIARRMVSHVIAESSEAVHAAQSLDSDRLTYVIDMDRTLNKLADFCSRIIQSTRDPGAAAKNQIVNVLEQLGDQYALICKHVAESKKPLSQSVHKALKESQKIPPYVATLTFDFSFEKLTKMHREKAELDRVCRELLKSAERHELPIIFHIRNIGEIMRYIDYPAISLWSAKQKN
jgi:phosphate uptake regulator